MKLSPLYREALTFAYDLHRDQERKELGVPYMAHVLGVSSLTLEFGGDEEQAIAALLHDAAEDQGGAAVLAEIRSRFGVRVADIVRECTDSLESPKPPWKERKVRYLEHLARAPVDAQLVAACDKLYNLNATIADYRQQGEALWPRFAGGKAGVLWYFRSLADGFNLQNPVLETLRRGVAELESLVREHTARNGGVG
ncbi:MAG TPA: HD domain-containing protein [Polyangiaceae bacterium]|nr:HD domain-containing protein [Polyangiaceae bacterium]